MLDILSANELCCDRYIYIRTHTHLYKYSVLSFEGNQIHVNKIVWMPNTISGGYLQPLGYINEIKEF